MGIIKDLTKIVNYGVDIPEGYARIVNGQYNFVNNEWVLTVRLYMTPEARDKERLSEYFTEKYSKEPFEKPSNISDKKWEEITILYNLRGNVTNIGEFTVSVSNDTIKPMSINKKDLYKASYYFLKNNSILAGAEDKLDDTPIEELVEKFMNS